MKGKALIAAVLVSVSEDGSVALDSETGSDSLADEAAARVLHSREGGRLRVWVESDSIFLSPPSGQLRVGAPRGIDIVVETSSGSVSVDGTVGGKCSIHTISGGMRIRRVRSRLSVNSVSGSIFLDAAEGSVDASTVSGTVHGRALKLIGDSSFSSVSGDIDVELAPGVETHVYDLQSVSGSITIGSIRAQRGLRMGFAGPLVRGHTVSGALSFR